MGGDFQALTLGSDDELAMRKCLIHFFPRACIVVCSRHIKENIVRKLDELLGKSSDVRRQLLDALFGSSGLVSLENVVAFDNAVDKLRAPIGDRVADKCASRVSAVLSATPGATDARQLCGWPEHVD